MLKPPMQYNRLSKREVIEAHNSQVIEAERLLLGKTTQASKEDYEAWLAGYINNGGEITHTYDYSWSDRNWCLAVRDFRISPLCGSDALYIIVKSGVKLLGGDLGHSEVYLMDGFKLLGSWVPTYEDIRLHFFPHETYYALQEQKDIVAIQTLIR